MPPDFLNYALAFAEGFGLVLSPCILPILPIILIGGIEGGKYRPYGIIVGFVLSFALFTLFARAIIQTLNIDLDHIRQAAYVVIILFGLILISDKLSEIFNHLTIHLTKLGTRSSQSTQQSGFFSGLLLGIFISLIWVPCGGPILAAAIIQSAIQNTLWQSFLIFFFFALGSVVPMTLITLFSKKLFQTMQFFKKHANSLRKVFGLVIIVSAIYTGFIGTSAAYTPMPQAPNVVVTSQNNQLIDGLASPYPAPDFKDIALWLNSPPLTISQLHGKVVLIDFWTYSCINCIRTLPYLKDWYNKYHQEGLIIIGVHTPEFEFEKNADNVAAAIQKYGIHYPVALDNHYATWLNYNNQYWPAHYLIDRNGNVVYIHFGEGSYAETEHNIQVLLGRTYNQSSIPAALTAEPALFSQITPETYLGSVRAQNYAGQPILTNGENDFSLPPQLERDQWALLGHWSIQPEWIQASQANAAVKIHFHAKKVFAVLSNDHQQTYTIQVKLNQQVINKFAGKDVKNGLINIDHPGLYEIISLPDVQSGILELIVTQPGVKVYTFTFGG